MNVIESLQGVMNIEADAIRKQSKTLDSTFEKAVTAIASMDGKLIFTGVGKSGHIGKKLAASFSSLGIPSIFMHSTEAVHGDYGIICSEDIVFYLTNSGETSEVVGLIPTIQKMEVTTISLTSNPDSTISRNSTIALNYVYEKEADAHNIAPTTSSTLLLAIGDALAVTVSKMNGFTREDFKFNHPGGNIGIKLGK